MGNGLNFFTNAIDKTPATKDSYQDVDVSGDGVPSGASGVILELRSVASGTWNTCKVRKNGSSFDPTAGSIFQGRVGGYAFCQLDANRVFEANVSPDISFYLIGYTGSDVVYFDSPTDDSPTATDAWTDIDKSASIPSGATGVIALLTKDLNAYAGNAGIRCNGSTDTFPLGILGAPWSDLKWQYCGLDANRVLEMNNSTATMILYIYAYTKGEVTFKVNAVENSPSAVNAWTDVDVTSQTAANADGVLLMAKINTSYGSSEAHVRKNGSSDNRTTGALVAYSETAGTGQCCGLATGLDSGQVYEAYVGSITELDVYVIGYNAPAGATLQTVTDSLSLSDAVLRHKTLAVSDGVGASDAAQIGKNPLIVADALGLVDAILRNKQFALTDTVALAELVDVIKGLVLKIVADSVGLQDAVLRDKVLALIDAVSLLDAVSTPSRVLRVLDTVGLADGALVNKVLQVSENISLVEVVEVGTGGAAKKTKLFLVLGDVALQLTGD